MQIEAGKFYRTRDGQKIGPMCHPEPDSRYGWNIPGLRRGRWDIDGEDGEATGWGKSSGGDLIAEWIDTPDLTAIKTPFGLLDDATREALKAHGGPWEYFGPGGDWRDWTNNTNPWFSELAYRVKPQPPKPREWWIEFDGRYKGFAYPHEHQPEKMDGRNTLIHVREVIDNA